jgi:hypothetical protein
VGGYGDSLDDGVVNISVSVKSKSDSAKSRWQGQAGLGAKWGVGSE